MKTSKEILDKLIKERCSIENAKQSQGIIDIIRVAQGPHLNYNYGNYESEIAQLKSASAKAAKAGNILLACELSFKAKTLQPNE